MQTVMLNNGTQMPIIGYGTYQTPAYMTEQCVTDAIRVGYRSIDASLKRIDMDYIDLLLIHEPTGDVHEIYRAMESA